jgi:hypothetical protein
VAFPFDAMPPRALPSDELKALHERVRASWIFLQNGKIRIHVDQNIVDKSTLYPLKINNLTSRTATKQSTPACCQATRRER